MAHFFGFGSLVNTATHCYCATTAARVKGWSRAWINNDIYPHAFLSVTPDENSQILGLIAAVPNNDWAALDQREIGYERRILTQDEWQSVSTALASEAEEQQFLSDVQMYVHNTGEFAKVHKPILWSYLETVLFGYYQVFGASGVQGFVDSTQYWVRIVDDRTQPLYPRYVPSACVAADIIIPVIESLSATHNCR